MPKLLIVSHTSFTKSDSMGSTLASYFSGYDSDRLAQFYIKDMKPDIPVCENYYRVTDREVLNAVLSPFSKKDVGKRMALDTSRENSGAAKKDIKSGNSKSRALRMTARDIVWSLSRFQNKGFEQWLDEFSPDAVLVQPGDFPFLLKLATGISKRRDIPLIVHQSESYYLKPYFSKRLSYLIYRKGFDRAFERMMKRASLCIYLCEALQTDYDRVFDTPSATVYKSTDILPLKRDVSGSEIGFRCVYGGNLGQAVGRAKPLCELGKAIKKCGGVIDVYTASTGSHLRDLTEENGIVMHEAIPNTELMKRIQESDFVIHVENQSEPHKTDLKYAFSTKIADMLACGRPSIIYGSTDIAGIRYFSDNDLGLVVEREDELYPKILGLIKDKRRQDRYVERAIEFAKANHDPSGNALRIKELIIKVCKE